MFLIIFPAMFLKKLLVLREILSVIKSVKYILGGHSPSYLSHIKIKTPCRAVRLLYLPINKTVYQQRQDTDTIFQKCSIEMEWAEPLPKTCA